MWTYGDRQKFIQLGCQRMSLQMAQIIGDYSNHNQKTDENILAFLVLSILTIVTVIEFVIYLAIFAILHGHNMAMRPFLPVENLTRRTRGNVINLSGQAINFVFEITCLAVFGVTIYMADFDSYRIYAVIMGGVFYGAGSLIQMFLSPILMEDFKFMILPTSSN